MSAGPKKPGKTPAEIAAKLGVKLGPTPEDIAKLKKSVREDIESFEREVEEGLDYPEGLEAEEQAQPDFAEEMPAWDEGPKPNGHAKTNGHAREPPPQDPEDVLEVVDIGAMAELPIPPRRFLDGHKFLLMQTTHVLAGDGGAGKTELVCQLMIGCCGHGEWLNLPIEQGPALFFSAEEPVNEIRRRVHHLCDVFQIHPSALKGMHVIDATEKSAWLFEENLKTKRWQTTPRWEWFVGQIERIRPKVVIIDNRMRIFSGNQIDTVMAVNTISMLDRVARLYDCVIVLVSHPSLTQMSTGRGDSGSVAWSNAARSRSYLHHPELDRNLLTDGDDGQRRLTSMKANATKTGIFVEFLWDEVSGYFKCIYAPPRADETIGQSDKAERVFFKLLTLHNRQKIRVSAAPQAHGMFAPSVFAGHPGNERVTVKLLRRAMEALLASGKIEQVNYGFKSRGTLHLLAKGEYNF